MSLLPIDPDGDLEIILTNPHSGIRQFIDRGGVHGSAPYHPPALDDWALKPMGGKKDKKKNKRRGHFHSRLVEDPPPPPLDEELPAEELLDENTVAEELLVEEPLVEEPLAEEPLAEEPLAEEPLAEELLDEEASPLNEPPEEDPMIKEAQNDEKDLKITSDDNGICHSSQLPDHSRSLEIRLLVSSKHLCLASSTFRRMLGGPWLEGSEKKTGLRTAQARDFDAEAFIMVLDIMHGKHFTVPQTVSLELLANIACIVDYYDCHEVMEPFVTRWIKALGSNPPAEYGRQCMLWMSVSWVFLREYALISMAKLAVLGCWGPIDDMGLPLPEVLLRKLNEKREDMIDGLLSDLNRLWSILTNDRSCRPGCSYMLLGALTSHMKTAGVFFPLQKPEPYGDSVECLQSRIASFDSPTFGESNHGPFHTYAQCSCRLKTRITPIIDGNLSLLKALDLEDICTGRLQQRAEAEQTALSLRSPWLSWTVLTA